MLASTTGLACRPSCAQVTISTSSSKVPMPPGKPDEGVGHLGHERLALVHGGDHVLAREIRDARSSRSMSMRGITPITRPPACSTASATMPMSPRRAAAVHQREAGARQRRAQFARRGASS